MVGLTVYAEEKTVKDYQHSRDVGVHQASVSSDLYVQLMALAVST